MISHTSWTSSHIIFHATQLQVYSLFTQASDYKRLKANCAFFVFCFYEFPSAGLTLNHLPYYYHIFPLFVLLTVYSFIIIWMNSILIVWSGLYYSEHHKQKQEHCQYTTLILWCVGVYCVGLNMNCSFHSIDSMQHDDGFSTNRQPRFLSVVLSGNKIMHMAHQAIRRQL